MFCGAEADFVVRKRYGGCAGSLPVLLFDDGDGEAAGADEFFVVVVDLYFPDMSGFAGMQGCCDAGDKSFADAAEVIGIYLDADAVVLGGVDDERGGNASESFGEDSRCAAVEKAIGLFCAMVDR